MEVATSIKTWEHLLGELTSGEQVGQETLHKLAHIFEHLPPQVAPRLQKDYDTCASQSYQLLGELFEKIDISDKEILNALLSLFVSYGNYRLTQLTYHIEGPRDDLCPDTHIIHTIESAKWYDLCPLLPPAGTIGWKHTLIHGLVIEERKLYKTCLQLLTQKLHFYAISTTLHRFERFQEVIHRNGQRVSEKLAEKILDFANDDEDIIGIDSFLFNLLLPFTTDEQQAAIIEAIIRDRFKLNVLSDPRLKKSKAIARIHKLVDDCITGVANLQEVFIKKLLENLKLNVIRRKRRHSVEANENNVSSTLESIISDIINQVEPVELLPKLDGLNLSKKSLQTTFIAQWVEFLHNVLTRTSLTPQSSVMITSTCAILLAGAADILPHDLTVALTLLMTKSIDCTALRKLDKFFKSCSPQYIVELTKFLAENTELLDSFDTPIKRFYRSYLAVHMRFCVLRPKEAEKFAQFVSFICDKNIDKNKSYLLLYTCLVELTEFHENLKNREGNKLLDVYTDYSRSISSRLFKFLKHRSIHLKENDSSTELENGSSFNDEFVLNAVVDATVCILKIALDRKQQDILDTYGDLMLRLYNLVSPRVVKLADTVRHGTSGKTSPLDLHLPRLISLYVEHRAMIEPYLCYDLIEKISSSLSTQQSAHGSPAHCGTKDKKKLIYKNIKSKLESLDSRAEKFSQIFQTIINKQYKSVVDQSIGQAGENLKQEESCCKKYVNNMKTLKEVSSTIFNNCDPKIYDDVIETVVVDLEICDALDHARVLYLLLMLESLMPKNVKDSPRSISFIGMLPRISCSLVRISKSVELGPSIHSFTNCGSHKSSGGIQCCTYANCIKVYTLVFNKFPPKTTNSLITDAMQISVSSNLGRYAKYSTRLHLFFIQLATAIASLLKSVSMGRKEEEILRSSMPIFLSVFSLLIRCIIMASDRQKLEELPHSHMNGHDGGDENEMEVDETSTIDDQSKVYEAQIESLARDVGRMLNNLSSLEVKLVDYAPHLISMYIKDTQRAACPDFVKKHLDEGVFRIFNLVDAHQKHRQEEVIDAGIQRKTTAGRAKGSLFDMIHARLDQASREIFRNMHDNYNRFHRYVGKC